MLINLRKDYMEENNDILNEESIRKRKFYYSKPFILFAMLDWARGRETCFLVKNSYKSSVRYLNAGSVEIFMKYLGIQTNTERFKGEQAKDPFKFFTSNKNYSIYCSLGKIDWSRCPIKAFSYAVKERQAQQELIREDLINYMEDFTPGIDFDGDQSFIIEKGKEKKIKLEINQKDAVNRALEDLKTIIPIFNEYKIEWFCQFSGSRGFHFLFNIPLDIPIKQKVEVSNKVLKTLEETFDLQTLDRGSYNHRKVFKTPYSIVTTNNLNLVVLPLSDKDLENFDLDKLEVQYVYNNVRNLKIRGLIWRNSNINKKESIKLFNKFLKDYEIEITNGENLE